MSNISLVPPYNCERLFTSKKNVNNVSISGLPILEISSRVRSDAIMIGTGGFSPLTGFMNRQNWYNVCSEMRASDGTFWPIPITLDVSKEDVERISLYDRVGLSYDGRTIAYIEVEDIYKISEEDKIFECETVFKGKGKDSTEFWKNAIHHPGVAKVLAQKEYNIAGPVILLDDSDFSEYKGIYKTPSQLRKKLNKRKWFNCVAFQTRNPMHRSHEALVKTCIDSYDGVVIHMSLGRLKNGDVPAEVRIKCIQTLVEKYFVTDKVIIAGHPLEMRYAGPREALLHAIYRQNCGISNIIIGRDHAGVSNFYGEYEAQKIFDIASPLLRCNPVKMSNMFYCLSCDGMASERTCPHDNDQRVIISGTELRNLLSNNLPVPEHFCRNEVLDVLKNYYNTINRFS